MCEPRAGGAVDELDGTEVEYRAGQVQFTREAGPIDAGTTRAIVGGTGEYFGASGEVTATPGGGDRIDYELEFELPDD